MRFYLALLLLLLLASGRITAQTDPDNGSKSNSTYLLNTDTGKVMDIREKLVQLALQNPTFEIADRTVAIMQYTLRLQKNSWLSAISAQGNLNEFSIDPKAAGGNSNSLYYPKYNFGLSIPMDIFTRTSNNIKIARENYMIAIAQKNDKYRQIKLEVLSKYEDYILAKENLQFQIQIAQDEYASYKRTSQDFSDGLIKLEDLNLAYRSWVLQQTRRLTLQRDFNVTKLQIEQMIGVKLDDVLSQLK
ncbi:MAG: TolC family protein [Puia sp.]|nr:TolC family protein [Puia sp.]